MICDEYLCVIILLYVPRRSFIALFARFRKSRILLGFEHLLDFGELGSSFEKSEDTFELLEVERDSE